MGTIEDGVIRPRDVASAGCCSEHLRRVVASQELTVDAALAGDRDLVVKAMLADPVAGSLALRARRRDDRRDARGDGALAASVQVGPQLK